MTDVLRGAGILELIRTDKSVEADRTEFLAAKRWCFDVASAYEDSEDMPAILKLKYDYMYNIVLDLGEKYAWL